MLTTISSAFQKPFACNAWTGKTVRPLGKTVRPLEPSAFILLIKYTEHSPNLLSGVKSINQLAYLESSLQSFRTSLKR